MMRKLLAVFIICMILSVGCAPVNAPTIMPTSEFPTLSAPRTTPTPSATLMATLKSPTPTVPTTTPTPVGTLRSYPGLYISLSVADPWCNSGRCWYQWEIHGNGQVRYKEKGQGMRTESVRSATITPQQIQELVEAVWQAGAIPLRQEPSGLDQSQTWFSITFDGRSKQAVHFYGSPVCGGTWPGDHVGLCELERKLEAIANQWRTPMP